MTDILMLPGLKADPGPVFGGRVIQVAGAAATVEEALAGIAAALGEPVWPDLVTGGEQTPAVWWLAALGAFPAASHVAFTDEGWLDVRTGDLLQTTVGTPQPGGGAQPEVTDAGKSGVTEAGEMDVPPENTAAGDDAGAPGAPEDEGETGAVPEQAVCPPQRMHEEDPDDPRTWPDRKLIDQALFVASWSNADGDRLLQQLRAEALARRARSGALLGNFEKAVQAGRRAGKLKSELERLFRQGKPEGVIRSWLEAETQGQPAGVKRILNSAFKKQKAFFDNKRGKNRGSGSRQRSRTQLRTVRFEGAHPNSIPHLAATQQWTILVDETGSGHDVRSLSGEPGRLVAVVVPQYTQLPDVPAGAHGVTDSDEALDKRVSVLLDNPVGIFGFAVNDPDIHFYSWMTSIEQLIRWVAMQIPVKGSSPRLHFIIENRAQWKRSSQLQALSEVLEAQLRRLRPEAFANLSLKLEIAPKNGHPWLAYADVVGYTWGSKSKANRARLRATRWQGHCLLNQDQDSLARVFASVTEGEALQPGEWYALFEHPEAARVHALLADWMDRLGKRLGQEPERWQMYLDEVQLRIARKAYEPGSLAAAMDWLSRYQPDGTVLPPRVRLAWQGAQLASRNHLGEVDDTLTQALRDMAEALVDEAPVEATEAILRVCVNQTNAFRFEAARSWAQGWYAQHGHRLPRSLRGKLQSQVGQLLAFDRRWQEADDWFGRALDTLGGLSDPKEAAREQLQTRIYRLISRMDAGWDAGDILPELADCLNQALGNPETEGAGRLTRDLVAGIAASGPAQRYAHHLLLRTFMVLPEATQQARKWYFASRDQWQMHGGHPWPLIGALRAALCLEHGDREAASQYLEHALESLCEDERQLTLLWMADALRLWAHACGLSQDAPEPSLAEPWAERLPSAPAEQMAEWARSAGPMPPGQAWQRLGDLLPFNFR